MKTCTKCGLSKPESEFAWRNKTTGKRAARCLVCTREAINSHYVNNTGYYKKKAKIWDKVYKIKVWTLIANHLVTHPCVDCGETDLRVLEFDHVRGVKEFSISEASRRGISIQKIVEEIAKCDVRCANHHRIVTAQRGDWGSNDIFASISALASNQLKQ